jgi:hypothetical protein
MDLGGVERRGTKPGSYEWKIWEKGGRAEFIDSVSTLYTGSYPNKKFYIEIRIICIHIVINCQQTQEYKTIGEYT